MTSKRESLLTLLMSVHQAASVAMTSKWAVLCMVCLSFTAFSVLFISALIVIPRSWSDPFDIACHSIGVGVSAFAFRKALKNVLTNEVRGQLRSLAFMQGISLAMIMQALSIWTTYRFDSSLTVYEPNILPSIVIPVSIILVFAVLIVHLRNGLAWRSKKDIGAISLISLVFLLLPFGIFTRPMEDGAIAILLAQLSAYFTNFAMRKRYYYYAPFIILTAWLLDIFSRAADRFIRGGGF